MIDATEIARRLARMRKLAWLLDAALRLPGTRFRFGLNGLLGLPPEFGDVLLVLVSLYFVIEALRLQVPKRLLGRMLVNIAVEFGLGAVPVLGDLLDMVWKANLRNVALLERHFADP